MPSQSSSTLLPGASNAPGFTSSGLRALGRVAAVAAARREAVAVGVVVLVDHAVAVVVDAVAADLARRHDLARRTGSSAAGVARLHAADARADAFGAAWPGSSRADSPGLHDATRCTCRCRSLSSTARTEHAPQSSDQETNRSATQSRRLRGWSARCDDRMTRCRQSIHARSINGHLPTQPNRP